MSQKAIEGRGFLRWWICCWAGSVRAQGGPCTPVARSVEGNCSSPRTFFSLRLCCFAAGHVRHEAGGCVAIIAWNGSGDSGRFRSGRSGSGLGGSGLRVRPNRRVGPASRLETSQLDENDRTNKREARSEEKKAPTHLRTESLCSSGGADAKRNQNRQEL